MRKLSNPAKGLGTAISKGFQAGVNAAREDTHTATLTATEPKPATKSATQIDWSGVYIKAKDEGDIYLLFLYADGEFCECLERDVEKIEERGWSGKWTANERELTLHLGGDAKQVFSNEQNLVGAYIGREEPSGHAYRLHRLHTRIKAS